MMEVEHMKSYYACCHRDQGKEDHNIREEFAIPTDSVDTQPGEHCQVPPSLVINRPCGSNQVDSSPAQTAKRMIMHAC